MYATVSPSLALFFRCETPCHQRRRELLNELRNFEILGQAIPQCVEDGVLFRKRQCLAGTDVCWCVTKNGRRLSRREYRNERECETVRRRQENMALKAAALLKEEFSEEKNGGKTCSIRHPGECPNHTADLKSLPHCQCDSDCGVGKKCCRSTCMTTFSNTSTTKVQPESMTNTTATPRTTNKLPTTLSLVCGANEQYSACYSPCQASCEDPTTMPCPSPGCSAGCICLPGFIRRDGSPRSACVPRGLCAAYDTTMRCADDRRQYQTCGSACPISCDTRNSPRCSEKCVSGCFCRIPFVLENGQDPLHSRCILPSECPIPKTPPPPLVARQPASFDCPDLNRLVSFLGVRQSPRWLRPHGDVHQYPGQKSADSHPGDEKSVLGPLEKLPELRIGVSCGLQLKRLIFLVGMCTFLRFRLLLPTSLRHDPQSECVLAQQCPRKSSKPTNISIASRESCSDPRKEWTSCGARQCARSCHNPLGRCPEGQCSPGCVCREPYVLQDSSDPTSRCVLPTECERKCDDPAKEYITCGSSCPMGCDNLHPKNCAPCQAGCFCRNGLVFLNSSNWQASNCVRLENCPPTTVETTQVVTSTLPTVFTHTQLEMTSQPIEGLEIAKEKRRQDQCPPTTFDVGGRSCSTDTDCPVEQRCCRPMIVALGVSPQRCVCPDPKAVWSACGSVCPEYCGQPSVPVCSSTCSAGCHCAPGFVKSRNDLTAPCVPREQCSRVSPSHDQPEAPDSSLNGFRATIKEIPPENPFLEDTVAVAVLVARDSSVMGRFTFAEISSNTMKIRGEVFGLPSGGPHAVVLHQFGDTSDGCSRIGPPYSRSANRTPSMGDVTENGVFDRVVDWPVSDVVGRSVVIYRFSTSEWTEKAQGEKPLACGTIGLTKVATN
ncbi:unnamed protein product [Caenorhabditis auriculariae]|uniref:Thyroglobulin type-1 domain-containing protein n=1 Tax=Caenorhabditis auriculariae TaxID=2777116 RepID=A0A8S1H2W3_9PELO|nr:unnamed protein product [Caenorhabditis auriculariae]